MEESTMKSIRLKFVAIKNFRSIIDTKRFFLPEDGIAVLVGQNESGKTSVIEALEAFGTRKLDPEDRNESRQPTSITCTFRYSTDYLKSIFQDSSPTLSYLENYYFEGALDFEVEARFQVGKNIGGLAILSPLFAEQTPVSGESTEKSAESAAGGTSETAQPASQSAAGIVLPESLKPTEINQRLLSSLPKISVFKDDSLLPREILLQDIKNDASKTNGIKGARNFLKVLGVDPVRLEEDITSATARLTLQEELNRDFTADFNDFWTQEVVEGNRATVHVGLGAVRAGLPAAGQDQLTFTVETKKKHLFPDQRSKGFQWFLSFYLQLMVLRRDQAHILLLDEPGAHLHIKAKKNLLKVLEEVKDNAQIIYTTHEPELIELEQLHRIRVVSQTADEGTIVETVEHAASRSGAADALSPIYKAIGASFANAPLANKTNILLEEPSAFYYLQGWKKLLGVADDDIFLLPAMGANTVPTFYNLLAGWGFKYKVILDDDSQGRDAYNRIVEAWALDDDEKRCKLFRLDPGPTIELQFTSRDFQRWVLGRSEEKVEKNVEIPKLLRNSEEGKALLAKKFFDQVQNKSITKKVFEGQTISNFSEIFSFIQKG